MIEVQYYNYVYDCQLFLNVGGLSDANVTGWLVVSFEAEVVVRMLEWFNISYLFFFVFLVQFS